METKICIRCELIKQYDEFNKDKNLKSGISNICKVCKKKLNYNYRISNPKKYKLQQKKYRDSNKDKEKLRIKNWVNENKDRRTKYTIKYDKERKKIDPKYKLLRNLRTRIYVFLKKYKITKSEKTISLVGCDLPELKFYMENKFTNGMSWDNYGSNGWHVDHIIPLSSAKTEEEIYKLCHFTNLQPLWEKDNLAKSNKIIL
jgi:hypothetical protein